GHTIREGPSKHADDAVCLTYARLATLQSWLGRLVIPAAEIRDVQRGQGALTERLLDDAEHVIVLAARVPLDVGLVRARRVALISPHQAPQRAIERLHVGAHTARPSQHLCLQLATLRCR